eukprot:12148926-Alexandrium_andersonii.AAC.1
MRFLHVCVRACSRACAHVPAPRPAGCGAGTARALGAGRVASIGRAAAAANRPTCLLGRGFAGWWVVHG